MSKNSLNKIFMLWVIFTLMFIFTLSEAHFMQKTINGEKFENFSSLTSKYLPLVLANYIKQNYIRFHYYKIPNYVKDLFKYNKEFYPIYNSKKKHTVIIFTSKKNNNPEINRFNNKLSEIIKIHQKDFNIISFSKNKKINLSHKAFHYAFNDLSNYCNSFCIIDPERNTLFTIYKITNSEIEALDIIFQEFGYLAK